MHRIIVTGAKGKLSCKTADRLSAKPDISVTQLSLRGDWQNYDFSDTFGIVHIAGVTPQNAKSEEDYEKINYELTKELATLAKSNGVKQFIFISSMAVYGLEQSIDPKNGTVNENTPCMPKSEYGKSKLKAEEYLTSLRSESFKVCIIRVPSIFDSEKTEYIDQYKYLADKYPFIPKTFIHNYKSFIHSDNLCELIYLSIASEYDGILCPDEGRFSAFDICRAIYPNKPKSRFFGIVIELFMKKNPRILDYYGAIYYSESLTNAFNGEYRKVCALDAIRKLYEQ